MNAGTDHALQREAYHRGELFVGEEDHAVEGKGEGALRHVLHHDAVGFIGSLERIDAVAVGTRNHHRVYFAAAQRAQGFFGFVEAFLKVSKAFQQVFA